MTVKKRANIAKWFLVILCLSSQAALAANSGRADLRHRFGMRFTAGGLGYATYLQRDPFKFSGNSDQTDITTSITDSTSVGWGAAGKLGFTWLPTNALELEWGFRYTYSQPLIGTDAFSLPYAVYTGFRYYTNPQEPIMAYFSPQVAFQVTHMSVEVGLVWGMQWRVSNVVSLFYELGASAYFAQPKVVENKETIGNDIGGGISILPVVMGLHFHF